MPRYHCDDCGACGDDDCEECEGCRECRPDVYYDDDDDSNGVTGYHQGDRSHWSSALHAIRSAGEVAVGVEIEVVCDAYTIDDCVSEVKRMAGYLAEHDGSLPQWGFEIVGPPQSLATAGIEGADKWVDLLPAIHAAGARAWHHRECGMHVTIDTNTLDNETVAKIILAVHTWHHIPSIAGRDGNNYAVRRTGMDFRDALGFASGDTYSDKYSAVHVRNNGSIELRVFRSNVKLSGYQRVMHWIRALVEYARAFDDFSEVGFLAYVAKVAVPTSPDKDEQGRVLRTELNTARDNTVVRNIELTKVESLLSTVRNHYYRVEQLHVDQRNVLARQFDRASRVTDAAEFSDALESARVTFEKALVTTRALEEATVWLDYARAVVSDASGKYNAACSATRALEGALRDLDNDTETVEFLYAAAYPPASNLAA